MEAFFSFGLAVLPTPLAALIAIGVPVLISLAIGWVMFSIFTPLEFAQNVGVGSVKYGFVVEIYAVIAALSLVGAWDIYQSSRDQLQKEVGGLYMLALSVDTYSQPTQAEDRQEMRVAIREYAAAVVSVDWQAMQEGRVPANGVSEAAFQRLARAFLDVDPVTQAQQALQQNTSEWLGQVSEARIARLSVMSRTLSGLIWLLVGTLSVAVIVFQAFFGGASNALQYTMGAVIAVIVGGVILVSVKLAFPFLGDPPLLSARPFYEMMQVN